MPQSCIKGYVRYLYNQTISVSYDYRMLTLNNAINQN